MKIIENKEKAKEILKALVNLAVKHRGKPFQIEINGKTYTVIPRLARVIVGNYVKGEVITYTFPRSIIGLEATTMTVIVKGIDEKLATEITVMNDGTILVFPKRKETEIRKFLDAVIYYYNKQRVVTCA